MPKPRVILRRSDEYDADVIRGLVGESMDTLGLRPQGHTLVKPNCVIAHKLFFPNAFVRSEFLDGVLGALKERSEDIETLEVGERCGITIPTRYAFHHAGYVDVLRRHGIRVRYFDEMPQVRRELHCKDRLRDYVYIPEAISECDWFVDVPKFKAHPWTKVTFNLKNYIGIQDDEHRLIDHDHHLHTKIADLHEIIQPKLCVMDGIVAGAKTMLTPRPFPLGLVIIGNDAVAMDAVCTHIAGLDPHDVEHIRRTSERGWGTLDLDAISIEGDVTLAEAQQRAVGFELSLEKVDTMYNGKSRLRIYNGPPPDTYDYCWGGCPGALEEAVEIVERLQPDARNQMKPLHIVYGDYEGTIEPDTGEKVVFVGDCARYRGSIRGREVEIPFLYQERNLIRPESVGAGDLLNKILKYWFTRLTHLGKNYIRIRGCPVSVAENILLVARVGKTKNPYYDLRLSLSFSWHYVVSKILRFFGKRRKPSARAVANAASAKLPPGIT